MDSIEAFLQHYGYWLLAGVGFAEYVGVPIASVPVLITAGALASDGRLLLPLVAAAAAAGGLTADAIWYSISRWKGDRVVGMACGLTSNPRACVLSVRNRVEKLGGRYVLVAKFIPGAANLIAAGAGLSCLRALRFLSLDAVALLLWASVYVTLGWVFHDQVEAIVVVMARYVRWVAPLVFILITAGLMWRVARARRHARAHGQAQ